MTDSTNRPEDDPLDEFADCLHGALHGETCDFDRTVASGIKVQLPWRTDEILGSGDLPIRVVVESESPASTLSDIGEHHEQVASRLTDIIKRWGYAPPETFESSEDDSEDTVYIGIAEMPLFMPPHPEERE
jgi:hypothetical protein